MIIFAIRDMVFIIFAIRDMVGSSLGSVISGGRALAHQKWLQGGRGVWRHSRKARQHAVLHSMLFHTTEVVHQVIGDLCHRNSVMAIRRTVMAILLRTRPCMPHHPGAVVRRVVRQQHHGGHLK